MFMDSKLCTEKGTLYKYLVCSGGKQKNTFVTVKNEMK